LKLFKSYGTAARKAFNPTRLKIRIKIGNLAAGCAPNVRFCNWDAGLLEKFFEADFGLPYFPSGRIFRLNAGKT
jgi:hypothetical protein